MKRSYDMRLLLLGWILLLSACNAPQAGALTPSAETTSLQTTSTPVAHLETLAPSPTQTASPSAAPSPTTGPTSTPGPTNTPVAAGQKIKIGSVHMLDVANGWGVGNYNGEINDIFRTQDGGLTWKVVTPPQAAGAGLSAVPFFLDAQRGWVTYTAQPGGTPAKDALVWRTSDGGSTWQSVKMQTSAMNMEFFAPGQIGFSDTQNGWMLVHMGVGMMHDYVSIWKTSDGGASWNVVVDPDKDNLPMSCYKNSLWFRDPQHGFLAGSCGGVQKGLFMYATADGGATWQALNLPAPAGHADLFTSDNIMNDGEGLVFKNAQLGYFLVRSHFTNAKTISGWLYLTRDGGQTWKPEPLPTGWGSLDFWDADTGWFLGASAADSFEGTRVFSTADGGTAWKGLTSVNWTGAMQFVDRRNGWVVAKAGNATALVRTRDGGLTWLLLNPLTAK